MCYLRAKENYANHSETRLYQLHLNHILITSIVMQLHLAAPKIWNKAGRQSKTQAVQYNQRLLPY